MARPDDEPENRPKRRPPRDESVRPAKPRRPEPVDDVEEAPPRRPRRPARDEEEEDRRPRRRARDDDEDDEDDYEERPRRRKRGGIDSIIPYHNGPALASYYCSFGAIVVILGAVALAAFTAPNMNRTLYMGLVAGGGGLLALAAIVLGVLGLLKVKRSPEAKGTAHAIVGMLLGVGAVCGIIIVMILKPFLPPL